MFSVYRFSHVDLLSDKKNYSTEDTIPITSMLMISLRGSIVYMVSKTIIVPSNLLSNLVELKFTLMEFEIKNHGAAHPQ